MNWKKSLIILIVGLILFKTSYDHYIVKKVYVVIAVDVEQDIVPYLKTYRGITEGLPEILQILNKYKIKATFFVTGNVASKYPDIIREIAQSGHEIGSHSLMHEDFWEINCSEMEESVKETEAILENIIKNEIMSFRTPYQHTNIELVRILEREGYCLEASFDGTAYPHFIDNTNVMRLTSNPLFYPSISYPRSWIDVYEETIANQEKIEQKIIIVNLHSWEIIDLPDVVGLEEYVKPSGKYTYENFIQLLDYLKNKNVEFVTAKEVCKLLEK